MSNFIDHALFLLEDLRIDLDYPDTKQVKVSSDGKKMSKSGCEVSYGNRVLIEQNQSLKFLIMFGVLDFFVDSKQPDMEGKNFKDKYRELPKTSDSEVIFSELYRVARLIRNTMVHNPSSISMTRSSIIVESARSALIMNERALRSFYTSLFIFIRKDFGNGEYFLGLIRSHYDNILEGVFSYRDDIEHGLRPISDDVRIFPYRRDVVLNLPFRIVNRKIIFSHYDIEKKYGVLADFFIHHNEQDLLIPAEALDEQLSITEEEATDKWKLKGSLPVIDRPFLSA